MRLEANSKKLMAITKSKAKMYEFGIDESHHITLVQDPKNLLIATIGILGELAAIESRIANMHGERYLELKSQLISVSQYFDALDQSHVADNLSQYLRLVGSSAYYLADMPGSSLVLSKELPYEMDELTPNYLEGVLVWLLKSDMEHQFYRLEDSPLVNDIESFIEIFRGYFDRSYQFSQFLEIAHSIRKNTYECGNDRELLFIDVIVSLSLKKIANSSINCLPQYTDLSISNWLSVLEKPGFIKEFWPAQKLLGEKGILSGTSAVVQMPTSTGKTKSTELIIRSAFISGRATLAVVIAPFRALCREISSSFALAFDGEDVNINELQDVTLVSDDEEYFIRFLLGESEQDTRHRKSVLVSTPEKLVYLLRHEPKLADAIGLLIFDEGHQFDTGKRGVTYELLLASLKESVGEETQKILISAVMSNAESIGDWLNGEAGVEVQGIHCLPTVRSVAFVSWLTSLGRLVYIDQELEADRDFFVPRVIEQINLGTRGSERKDRLFPERNNASSMAAYLGVRLCHQGPVAIFCGVKSTVTTISELLVDYYSRGLQLSPPNASSDQQELDKISYLSSLHFGGQYILSESIRLGILPHSANIPNGLRVSAEWAMEHNKACLVVCTSTLAQGVNLPIKYLIVSSTFQAGQKISARDFHNLIGRVGRAGYHTEGSVIFTDSEIYDLRRHRYWQRKWKRAIHLLDFTNTEDCLSSLKELITPFDFEEIHLDVIAFITNPKDYREQCIDLATEAEIDIDSLLEQMDYKESLIQSIESYFLSHLKDNPDVDQSYFVELASNTLAYYLANEAEKLIFIDAFNLISRRVLSLDPEKFVYYGKALLGVEQLQVIEEWVSENALILELSDSPEDLLQVCWPLIVLLNNNVLMNKIQPQKVLLDFAQKWISGDSYIELQSLLIDKEAHYQAKTQARRIKMDHVIDFANGALSFDSMLYVGALADILEGQGFTDKIVDRVRVLQTRLKLGLSSGLELWLYSKGFVDREVCKTLSSALVKNGVAQEGFSTKILEQNIQVVNDVLLELPSYFSSSLQS
ncbi:MAG: DEAD/DEAH box helicase [Proteobacteria bacterium]|nr:DEAD/DEAH box helicase [Pseudomonadota bacterium]